MLNKVYCDYAGLPSAAALSVSSHSTRHATPDSALRLLGFNRPPLSALAVQHAAQVLNGVAAVVHAGSGVRLPLQRGDLPGGLLRITVADQATQQGGCKEDARQWLVMWLHGSPACGRTFDSIAA